MPFKIPTSRLNLPPSTPSKTLIYLSQSTVSHDLSPTMECFVRHIWKHEETSFSLNPEASPWKKELSATFMFSHKSHNVHYFSGRIWQVPCSWQIPKRWWRMQCSQTKDPQGKILEHVCILATGMCLICLPEQEECGEHNMKGTSSFLSKSIFQWRGEITFTSKGKKRYVRMEISTNFSMRKI